MKNVWPFSLNIPKYKKIISGVTKNLFGKGYNFFKCLFISQKQFKSITLIRLFFRLNGNSSAAAIEENGEAERTENGGQSSAENSESEASKEVSEAEDSKNGTESNATTELTGTAATK